MPVILKGFPELERRIAAVGGTDTRKTAIRQAGLALVAEMKRGVPRKTGTTGRSIRLGEVSATSAEVVGSKVASYLDTGTGLYGPYHHRVVPVHAKFLAWKTGSATRLSGRPRKGTPSRMVFAQSTAGMKPRPYINRALARAAQHIGKDMAAVIIERWNDAA